MLRVVLSVNNKPIGELTIENIGGDIEIADYHAEIRADRKAAMVRGFRRNRGAWALVTEALKELERKAGGV